MADPVLKFSPVTAEQFAAIAALAAQETGLTLAGDSGTAAHGPYEVGWVFAGDVLALQCIRRPPFLEGCVRSQLVKLVQSVCGPSLQPAPNAMSLARGIKRLHPYFKVRSSQAAAVVGPWSITELCTAYDWPKSAPAAAGGVIGIVELGGGWVASDIDAFFQSIGTVSPSITDVSVDGTQNAPGVSDADMEVALDIEIAGAAYAMATGKPATIRVYWSQEIQTAVAAAVADGCDVVSISWGADEANWGAAGCQSMEAAALAAVQAGCVVFGAAGDNDSSDGGSTPANVDCPASCPHVVACGGTSKSASAETVWNDNPGETNGEGTGGGYSTVFPAQSWQLKAPPPPAGDTYGSGRMVPDVAADADPETGYEIFVGGQQQVVGGTSAVAPLYAGLFAALGRKLGFVTPKLWQNPDAFTDITQGSNGYFSAAPGPDPCTGLGAPIGASIAELFVSPAAQ